MPFSTGTVTNTRAVGTAASNIVVSTRNLDVANPVTVTLHIFASVDSSTFYTAYLTFYNVPADSYDVREFFIAGNVAYEVQINVSSDPPSTLMTVVGIDESGNLVTGQRYAQEDLNFIVSLTPVM